MATARVMSPSRNDSHGDGAPLQTPILRLESIFERTSTSPPLDPTADRMRHVESSADSALQRRTSSGVLYASGARAASPEPLRGSRPTAARGGGASVRFEASPSPEPRADSDATSIGGSPSPAAVSDLGSLPQSGLLTGVASRSPFRGAASMSLDQMSPVASSTDGGCRLAGGSGRSPSPLRRVSAGGPGAFSGTAHAAQLRKRESTAVSMSIVQETPPPRTCTATGQPRRTPGRARSSSVHLAPSGYSASDSGSEPDSPTFSMRAPSGLTDDSSDGSDTEQQRRRRGGSTPFRRRGSRAASTPGPHSSSGSRKQHAAGAAASDIAFEFRYALQLRAERKVEALEAALAHIDAAEGAALDALMASRDERAASAADADGAAAAEAAAERVAMLQRLQAEHASKAAAGHAAVAEVEAAAARAAAEKQEAEQRRQLQQQAERQEAEQRAALQQQQQQQQQRQQQEAAQQEVAQRAASAQPAAAQPQSPPLPQPSAGPSAAPAAGGAAADAPDGSRLIAAASALAAQQECERRWAAAQAAAEPYRGHAASGAQRRKGDKLITLNVQQIAATQEQVGRKAQALVQFLAQQGGGAAGGHSMLVLANRIVAQCEVQVLRLHAFAFPLAEVAIAVAAAHPDFMPLLLARLHQVCQLAVPALRVYPKGTAVPAHERLAALGYREKERVGATDAMGDAAEPQLESTDDFLARVQGYVRLYAAVTQSAQPGNPHGLPHAWAFLARLLNHLPAMRITATVLEAFLRVAGFALWRAYRGQFVKLLHLVEQSFLAALQQGNDPDSRAIATRIRAFLHDNQFAESPEGRDMPRFDASSDVSCRA